MGPSFEVGFKTFKPFNRYATFKSFPVHQESNGAKKLFNRLMENLKPGFTMRERAELTESL